MVHDEIGTTTYHMGLAEATKEMPEWDGQNYIMVKLYVILALAQAVIYAHSIQKKWMSSVKNTFIRQQSMRWRQKEDHLLVLFSLDRKSTRLNSSHITRSRMPSSA